MSPGPVSSSRLSAGAFVLAGQAAQPQKPPAAPSSGPTSTPGDLSARFKGQAEPKGRFVGGHGDLSSVRSALHEFHAPALAGGDKSRGVAARAVRMPHSTAGTPVDRGRFGAEARAIRQQSDAYLDRLCMGSARDDRVENLKRILELGGPGAEACRKDFAANVAKFFSGRGENAVMFKSVAPDILAKMFDDSIPVTLGALERSNSSARAYFSTFLQSSSPAHANHPVRQGFDEAMRLGGKDLDGEVAISAAWEEEFVFCFQAAVANASQLGAVSRQFSRDGPLFEKALALMSVNPAFAPIPKGET